MVVGNSGHAWMMKLVLVGVMLVLAMMIMMMFVERMLSSVFVMLYLDFGWNGEDETK